MNTSSFAARRRARHFASAATVSFLLGLVLSPSAMATSNPGTPVDVNLSCKDFDRANILHETEFLVSPVPEGPTGHNDGTLFVSTNSYNSTNGWLFDWIQEVVGPSIHHVGISNSVSAVLYTYDPPVLGDRGLFLPASSAPVAPIQTITNPTPQTVTARFCYSTPGQTGMEGCTLGYWKVRQHHDSWPAPYTTRSNLRSVFGSLAFNDTLLAALNYKGGPGVDAGKRLLLKQAVAAFLSATSPDVNYPVTPAEVIADVTSALATNDRAVMLSLAATLDAYNNQGCPLN